MSTSDQSNPISREEFDGLSKQIIDLVVLLKELHQSTQGPKIPVHAESSTQGGTQGPDKAITIPELQLDTTNKSHDATHLTGDLDTSDIRKKVLQMEETLRSIKGIGAHGNVSYADLCIFSGVHYPEKFKTPDFEKYDGLGDPYTHLKVFIGELGSYAEDEKLRMQLF